MHYYNTKIDGGTQMGTYTSMEECRAACFSTPNCVGVDMQVDTSSSPYKYVCYSFTALSSSTRQTVTTLPVIIHADLVERCPSGEYCMPVYAKYQL